jgi:hypothetical protein
METTFQQEFQKAWEQVDWEKVLEPFLTGPPGAATPPLIKEKIEQIQETVTQTIDQPASQGAAILPWLGLGAALLVGKKLIPYAVAGTGAYLLLKKQES